MYLLSPRGLSFSFRPHSLHMTPKMPTIQSINEIIHSRLNLVEPRISLVHLHLSCRLLHTLDHILTAAIVCFLPFTCESLPHVCDLCILADSLEVVGTQWLRSRTQLQHNTEPSLASTISLVVDLNAYFFGSTSLFCTFASSSSI